MGLIRRVAVKVPATTSNLGPGFDCVGLALNLYNELTLELYSEPGMTIVEISGEGRDLPHDEKNPIVQAARLLLGKNRGLGRMVFRCVNGIPPGRGLGSSAAAALCGLYAANSLFSPRLESVQRLEELAIGLEGHPDNVAAAVRGGMVVSARDEGRYVAHPVKPHRDLAVVVCSPDYELPTKKSRAALPGKIAREDSVFNTARAMILLSAVEKGQWDKLTLAMQDRLHQPYRAPLIKGMKDVIAAAVGAGSCGAALSGAGPSIIALCESGRRASLIGGIMQKAFSKHGVTSEYRILQCDRKGLQVAR